jgi:predicted  nucleic acid-binding Zn-ribbon protein
MHPETQKLHAVHQCDVRLLTLERKLRNLDNGDNARAALSGAQRNLTAAQEELKQMRVRLADAEGALKAKEESRKSHEKRLYGGLVKKMEEVTAVEHEIEALKAAVSDLETAILEAMDAIETAEGRIAALTETVRQREAELAAVVTKYRQEAAALQQEISDVQKERADAAAAVEPAILARYDGIRKRTGDTGLAIVDGHICGGCRLPVPGLTMNALTGTQDLTTCDTCGRILYREGAGH